jgi:uncharacterized membrane protein HdeD (DUF308 family)
MNRDGMRILGILLLVLGFVALLYTGVTYTKREKVVDLGPIQVDKETRHTIPLPPIIGALALVGGIALIMSGRRSV